VVLTAYFKSKAHALLHDVTNIGELARYLYLDGNAKPSHMIRRTSSADHRQERVGFSPIDGTLDAVLRGNETEVLDTFARVAKQKAVLD
jgi:hypothetical protein